ncbi:MAG: DUF4249 domain-containing protein [Bacteroidota bacterium]
MDKLKCELPNFKTLFFSFLLLSTACIDSVEPEFQFRDNIIFIDAYALTEVGLSSVRIEKSQLGPNNFYFNAAVAEANVKFINVEEGSEVVCAENEAGFYLPPPDFKVNSGERWKLSIELKDGRRFESSAEQVGEAVEVEEIKAEFTEDQINLDAYQGFVPGHLVRIDWTDPAGEENFYLWRYKSYEPLVVCQTCEQGRFREGVCLEESNFRFRNFDYLCQTPCWLIRRGRNVQILEDRLLDGQRIENRLIAEIPFYRKQDILVEVQQLALSKSTYEYFKIINDILVESSSLNAPPPAALVGNLFNVDDPKEAVLGQFTAAASSTLSLFIERRNLNTLVLEPESLPALEDTTDPTSIITAVCEEGANQTAVEPKGWK